MQAIPLPNNPASKPDVPVILKQIIEKLPQSIQGVERLREYARAVNSLPTEARMGMRQVIEKWMHGMLVHDASDMDAGGHACAMSVWYRVNGEKLPRKELGTFSADDTDMLLLAFVNSKQQEELFDVFSIDFSYQLVTQTSRLRFRGTMYFDFDHLAINMRAITAEVRPLKSIGFHPTIEKGLLFSQVRDGITLVTGVTGSGKSSTLDAIIDANNQDFNGHIVLVGKPIEYVHTPKRCIVRHREVGKDVTSFKNGIVQALRQDPDIVVVGEMRDAETISAAIEIADTGHKVFSTLHTSSAVESIDRIIAEYPPWEQERIRNRLADTVRCIVSQKLCPKIGGGRVLAKEVLWITSSAKAAIKNDNTGEIYQMMWESTQHGQITMEQDLYRLAKTRQITPETAFSFANNKRRLQQLLR